MCVCVGDDQLEFRGFRVIGDASHHPLELIQAQITNLSGRFSLQDSQAVTGEVYSIALYVISTPIGAHLLQLVCSGSLRYVDLQDLAWVRASTATDVTLHYQAKPVQPARQTSLVS